jgi:hypothetical protein
MKLLVGIECLPALYFLLTYSGSQLYTPKAIGHDIPLIGFIAMNDIVPLPKTVLNSIEN